MIEVFGHSVKRASKKLTKLGEHTGVVVIKVAGKVVPILNLALTGYKIKKMHKSLNKECKSMKTLSSVLSDDNLDKLYRDDNNIVKKELKSFREASLKKRKFKATKDKLSLVCCYLGGLATVSGILLKTLGVIGIATGVGLTVLTGLGAVLTAVAILMIVNYYANRHNRNVLILNIKSVYRNVNLLIQSRKVKKAFDAFDKAQVALENDATADEDKGKKTALVVKKGLNITISWMFTTRWLRLTISWLIRLKKRVFMPIRFVTSDLRR